MTSPAEEKLDAANKGPTSIDTKPSASPGTPVTTSNLATMDKGSATSTAPQKLTNDSPQMKDLKSSKFTCFQRLPMELRVQILTLIHKPRLVVLRFANNNRSTQFDLVASIPVGLHISSAIRTHFLRSYKLLFKHSQCRRPVYFNSNNDTLLLHTNFPISITRSHQKFTDQVQRVMNILPNKQDVWHLAAVGSLCYPQHYTVAPPLMNFPHLRSYTNCFTMIPKELKCPEPHNWDTELCIFEEFASVSLWVDDTITSYEGSYDGFPLEVYDRHVSNRVKRSEAEVSTFLEDLHRGKWKDFTFTEPFFYHKALCRLGFNFDFWCPFLGLGKAAERRLAAGSNRSQDID